MKVWIFSLEPLPNRYSCEWHTYIPNLFFDNVIPYEQIDGDVSSDDTTPGAFLNFTNTNLWKSTQLAKFIQKVNNGEVADDDHILITDAWNPCVTQLKYIKELSNKNWIIHGLWHAGAYDQWDFLGRMKNKVWAKELEKSMFNSYDHNYFATDFHINLFVENAMGPWFDGEDAWMGEGYTQKGWTEIAKKNKKIIRSGYPFDYIPKIISLKNKQVQKKDQIVFAHRIAPEKQLHIFEKLKEELPQYEFIVCQEKSLTKDEYHNILLESKIVFSASFQETLGISQCIEGPAAGCIPLNPDRLSYSEIFKNHPEFLYPCSWTANNSYFYETNKEELKQKIITVIDNYDWYALQVETYLENDAMKFFRADDMMNLFEEYYSK
jgi:glycosyltransferase involved in cell wall biosynthesis